LHKHKIAVFSEFSFEAYTYSDNKAVMPVNENHQKQVT